MIAVQTSERQQHHVFVDTAIDSLSNAPKILHDNNFALLQKHSKTYSSNIDLSSYFIKFATLGL